MAKEIIITFDEKGNPSVDLKGFRGKGCKAVAQAFADVLGKTVESHEKPEIHQTEAGNRLVNA